MPFNDRLHVAVVRQRGALDEVDDVERDNCPDRNRQDAFPVGTHETQHRRRGRPAASDSLLTHDHCTKSQLTFHYYRN